MSASSVFPSRKELSGAAKDTGLLLKVRWRMVRERRSQMTVWVGLGFLMFALFAASNIGVLIRRFAEQGVDTAAGQFAVNYVIALDRGDLGVVGAAALGSSLAAAIFSPFTGSANLALIPADDLTTVRPTRLHRYFDSLITAAVSTIGFLQLFTLTTVASLLTIEGGRTGGLLFTWAVWPVLLSISTAEGWLIEYLHRSYGPQKRRAIAVGFFSVVGLALLIDPSHGKTLFGLGTLFAGTIAQATAGNTAYVVAAVGVLALLTLIFSLAGIVLCRAALNKPIGVPYPRKNTKVRLDISSKPTFAIAQIMFVQTLRTMETRRPLITILVLGAPAVWITGAAATTMTTLVIAVPLTVALAWGVNTFGVIGPAMTWLASQPDLMRRLFRVLVLNQIAWIIVIATAVWLPPFFGGRIDPGDIITIAAGTVVSSAFTMRSAAHKSVHRPHLARLGTRGDVIVPPLTAINYTLRLALWSGQLGVLVMSEGDRPLQLFYVTLAIAWVTARTWYLAEQWKRPEVRNNVIQQVSAD